MKRLLLFAALTLSFTAKPVQGEDGFLIEGRDGRCFRSDHASKLFFPGVADNRSGHDVLLEIYYTSDYEQDLISLRNAGFVVTGTEQHSNPFVWNMIWLDPVNIEKIELFDHGVFWNSNVSWNRNTILSKCHLPLNYGVPIRLLVEPPYTPTPPPPALTVIGMVSRDNGYVRLEINAEAHIKTDRLLIIFKDKVNHDDYRMTQKELDAHHIEYNKTDAAPTKAYPFIWGSDFISVKLECLSSLTIDGILEYGPVTPPDEPKEPVVDEPKEPVVDEPKEPVVDEPKEPVVDLAHKS